MPAASLSALISRAPPDDGELVLRAQRGETFAFDVLYRRHVQFVAAIAFRVGRVRSDVDDLVQEAFVTAFRRLPQLTQPAAFRGWLASIVVSLVHRRVRFHRLLRLFLDDEEQQSTLESMASPEASPEVRYQLGQLEAVVSKLPRDQRTAWILRFVLGCTLDEVAAGGHCSLATAKRRLALASSAVQRVVVVEISE
jgi:RNA polymerase sigma-70 factor (ECF subfamily)